MYSRIFGITLRGKNSGDRVDSSGAEIVGWGHDGFSRPENPIAIPRLLLVGCGHAHLGVLDSLLRDPWPDVEVVVVAPEPRQYYSGMVPGFLQGQYEVGDPALEVARVVERAGARFVRGRVVQVDGEGRTAEMRLGAEDAPWGRAAAGPGVDGGPGPPAATDREAGRGAAGPGEAADGPVETLDFDLASLDVGSVPGGLDRPGVRDRAWTLRPMDRAVALRNRVDELAGAASSSESLGIAVVGAGAGGFEVALALDRRARSRGAAPDVTLIDREDEILGEGYAPTVRVRALGILRERGIELLTGEAATAVEPDAVQLQSGAEVAADLVVWTTGAAPPPLLAASSLPLAPDGFFSVDATLRASDGSPVWGAGDCVSMEGHDVPAAGVYAVRQGPVLARNLRAALGSEEPEPYEPQPSFLSLLNTGDDRALLRWKKLVYHGRTAWWLKDWIDRRWVRRYR